MPAEGISCVGFALLGRAMGFGGNSDVTIVCSSSVVFGDPISHQQMVGFSVTLLGLGLWSHVKLVEQNQTQEATPIVDKKKDENP
eukprot:Skav231163  [mRNA]  locus=scaffold3252:251793:255043:- [translate_table: standard]